jgi:hypothetical protein
METKRRPATAADNTTWARPWRVVKGTLLDARWFADTAKGASLESVGDLRGEPARL